MRLTAIAGPRDARRQRPAACAGAELFDGADEVLIQHRGREYRLRVTQNGKLILNA